MLNIDDLKAGLPVMGIMSKRHYRIFDLDDNKIRVTNGRSNSSTMTIIEFNKYYKLLEDQPIINPHMKQTCIHSFKKERWFNATWHEYCITCGINK